MAAGGRRRALGTSPPGIEPIEKDVTSHSASVAFALHEQNGSEDETERQ